MAGKYPAGDAGCVNGGAGNVGMRQFADGCLHGTPELAEVVHSLPTGGGEIWKSYHIAANALRNFQFAALYRFPVLALKGWFK